MYPDVPAPLNFLHEAAREDAAAPHARVLKAVQSGRLSKATQLATSIASVAPTTPATLECLHRLHPAGPENPFGNRVAFQGPHVTQAQVSAAIGSTSYDTAGGPSGWSTTLLKSVRKCPEFLRFLTKLTNMIAQGTAPGARLLLASTLVPLQQAAAGKIRPIAIGEHFYRVAAKVLARNFRSNTDLHPCQLGVSTAGGVEPIIWKVQNAVSDNTAGAFVFLDLANAFNTMDRRHLASALHTHNPHLLRAARWAYGSASPLLMRSDSGKVEEMLLSSQGVRQGDPLGPLFFSYGYRERIERLETLLGPFQAEISAYLDDTVIWLPADPLSNRSMREQAQSALDLIAADFRDHTEDGMSLNLAKCHFHTTAEIQESGVQLLGTAVGTESFRRVFLLSKVETMLTKVHKVLRLPRQAAFLLLRECVAPTLLHLLRCLESSDLSDQWQRATAALHEAARMLAAVPQLDDAARTIATLPIRHGGLGLPDYGAIRPHARLSSKELCIEFANFVEAFQHPPTRSDLLAVRPPSGLRAAQLGRAEGVLAALEDHRRIAMIENASKLGSAWARMIPIYPTRVLSDRQVGSAIANRLLISSEAADQCALCQQPALFQHGDTCEARRQAPCHSRHTAVREILACQVRMSGSDAVTECAADAPEANPLLRGDILITGEAAPDGIAGVVDVSFTAPTSLRCITRGLRVLRQAEESYSSWTKRQLNRMTALREDEKRSKYRGAFTVPFTPVVFTTGGYQGVVCRAWLKRLGVYAQGKLASAFDLSVAIVRARAASLP
jgi:hypothetical protein